MQASLTGFSLSLLLHVGLVFAVLWLTQSPGQSSGLRPLNISISVFKSFESADREIIKSTPNGAPTPAREVSTPPDSEEERVVDATPEITPKTEPEPSLDSSPEPLEELLLNAAPEITPLPEPNLLPVAPPEPVEEQTVESTPETTPAPEIEKLLAAPSEPTEEKSVDQLTVASPEIESEDLDTDDQIQRQAPNDKAAPNSSITTGVVTDDAAVDQQSTIKNDEELRRYQSTVRDKIEEAKFYPRKARRLRKEGSVSVQFSITGDGQVAEIQITDSSNIPALDRAALEAVKKATPFAPFPAQFPDDFWRFDITLIYELN